MPTKISVPFSLGFWKGKKCWVQGKGCKAQEDGFPETFCDFLSFSLLNVRIDVAGVSQFVVINLYKLMKNCLPLSVTLHS